MKYTLTIESDSAEDIRSATEKLTGRVEAPAVTNVTNVAQPGTGPAPAQETIKAAGADTTSVAASRDESGMPYDDSIHATPPSTKTDGTWKVKKGQAEAAKAARAAFKASGGGITAPVVEETRETVVTEMPGVGAGGMPGMGESVAEPVSLEKVMGKWTELLQGNIVTKEQASAAATEATGTADGTQHYPTLQTNETARASLYAALTAYENAG